MSIKNLDARRAANKKNKVNSRKIHPESKFLRAQFVVWDGEGIEVKNGQVYGILAYKAFDGTYGSITNEFGHITYDCFEFMSQIAEKYPHATHIIYSGQYDVTMALKYGFNKNKIKEVYLKSSADDTYWEDFSICYIPKKMLRLNRGIKGKGGKWMRDEKGKIIYKSKMTLWDVIGFFACPFEQAVVDWLGEDYEGLEKIRAGKKIRGAFKARDMQKILDYCYAELDALLLIVERLHAAMLKAGITLKRWDGAGAVAAALMEKFGVKKHMSVQPDNVREAARYAFAGGRIECLQIGVHDETFSHDINSAYPHALLELPSLAEGAGYWKEYDGIKELMYHGSIPPFSMFLVQWNFKNNAPFYPFFFREDDGSIFYPPYGTCWVWRPEVDAALSIPENRQYIKILKALCYYPVVNNKPFDFIKDVYKLRLEYKMLGDKAEYVFKIGMSSVYGKTAQRVATLQKDGTYRKPPYHQLEYAGYITSYVRAQLYRIAMQAPQDIIMFATDGIYSTSRLDVPVSKTKELGLWTTDSYTSSVFVKSGIYWLDDHMRIQTRFRGFDKGAIQLYDYCKIKGREEMPGVLDQWRRCENLGRGPILRVPLTRFIGAGRALMGENSWLKYGTWEEQMRVLKLIPQLGEKRYIDTEQYLEKPHERLVKTIAGNQSGTYSTLSSPKSIIWERDALEENVYEDDETEEFA